MPLAFAWQDIRDILRGWLICCVVLMMMPGAVIHCQLGFEDIHAKGWSHLQGQQGLGAKKGF